MAPESQSREGFASRGPERPEVKGVAWGWGDGNYFCEMAFWGAAKQGELALAFAHPHSLESLQEAFSQAFHKLFSPGAHPQNLRICGRGR